MLSNHLEFLVGRSQEPESHIGLESWEKISSSVEPEELTSDESDIPNSYGSVVDVYQSSGPETDAGLLERLLQKQHIDLTTLHTALSSSRGNDEISGDLAEICGFDEIELVMEVISSRSEIVNEIAHHLSGRHEPETNELSADSARQRMAQKLRENAARPLFLREADAGPEILPHVYTSSSGFQGNVLSAMGSRYTLPLGTERQMYEDYEEVIIPPSKPVPPRTTERPITITELDPICRGSFPGYSTLNRVQSIVYPAAYLSNENLLICGMGKTDVAMLTIREKHPSATIDRDAFKIIYVAPMKALASEIVRKIGKRLKWLSIEVRELTGDMQLTKAEIARTQIIVTTPEKWDVVTRKPSGEGELAASLKLLIIDEVHLLNEERGAVIETIIARTLRQVESSQSVIRIVGLSATLPNYVDVAEFLSVSKQKGLFYFDSSFRPVPLEQHFIGIRGKPGSPQSRNNLDRVTFQKVSDLVAQGHQVMVFVHARKETVKTATGLMDMAMGHGNTDDFSCEDHPQWSLFRQNVGQSRNKEMKLLYDHGFGIHHAGMLRSDRNMMERMFEARAIKVLCCTATLAWGVNLPAHAVIIKGTQVYDSSKGNFVDLSVLDVLQVFGRAGRPGFEDSGEGYICTTDDKLTHYLDAVTSQNPIESQFTGGMIDALNAEISLGTVANVKDAVRWLGYTYLFVRMRKNPFFYGISRDEPIDDPQLGNKRTELVTLAARKLAEAGMILFDTRSGAFIITDLGRIAAKYYIRHDSVEVFNREFRQRMSEADVLGMLSMSTEFNQIQIRESEMNELDQLQKIIPCEVKLGPDSSSGKVNILLQGFISRYPVDDFALVSDQMYASQNGGRIARALLEIAISRKWASVSTVLMGISKAIEKRLWPYDQPLRQFDLKADVFYALETWADELAPAEIAAMKADELGKLIHMSERQGQAVLNAAKQFPTVKIEYALRPLTFNILKIVVVVTPAFTWNNKIHGTGEPFWLWVEDEDGLSILQLSHLLFRQDTTSLQADFIISIPDGQPPTSVTIRYVSDRWMGAEDEMVVSFESLVMPRQPDSRTTFRINTFNALQTQILWSLVNTKANCLICAPAGAGISTMTRIVTWMTVNKSSNAFVLIVVPRRPRSLDRTSRALNVSVEYGTDTDALSRKQGRLVRVVTSANLLHAMSQRDPKAPLKGIDLVILDHLEQLDPVYELTVSLLLHATQTSPTRFIGTSQSLSDPADLAAWLRVDPFSLFSFLPSDRGQALSTFTQTFNIPYSASLFKAMAKPAHSAIRRGDSEGQALVFVPSRGHCRSVGFDLITQYSSLKDFVTRGVGIFHEGIQKVDRNLILELWAEGIIRVLIIPRESCWSVPVRAATSIVMGSQYVPQDRGVAHKTSRQVREYDFCELVQMQSCAVRHSGSGQFYLFCQTESKDTILRFLNDGLPLESTILEGSHLEAWYAEQKHDIRDQQAVVDLLSFTMLARRIETNPAYYDCSGKTKAETDCTISIPETIPVDD
ncbi:Sec63-domain-containing protein [Mycena floridula]|nr:Sec63-domain-containing protein [Mycena floridula]